MKNTKKKPLKSASRSELTPAQMEEVEKRFNNNEALVDVADAMKVSLSSIRYRYEWLKKEKNKMRERAFNTIVTARKPSLL